MSRTPRDAPKLAAAYDAARRQRPDAGSSRQAAVGWAQKASHRPSAISGVITSSAPQILSHGRKRPNRRKLNKTVELVVAYKG